MNLESYSDVLSSMKKNSNSRQFHLLLGNGFSVAYDHKIFSYNALYDFVTKLSDSDIVTILKVIETRNFEIVMQYLDHFSALIKAFDADSDLVRRIDIASSRLKTSLLESVKELHPEHVYKVPENQSLACESFLRPYWMCGGNIFTTNYDLLLYWVMMRNNLSEIRDGFGRELQNDTDGFVKPEDQIWSDLVWGKNRTTQNVFYLHGAIHIFDAGVAIVKEEYDAYANLIEKISGRINKGEYPVFVTAGNGQQKLSHIKHNQYLSYCYEKLCQVNGSLVCLGFSFGSSDNHIIDAINRAAKQSPPNKLWSIYIGVFSLEDQQHIESIKDRFRCKVHMFDARSVDIWGKR